MEFPIRKLLKHRDAFEPLVWWKNLFGQAFSSVQPFLAPCEDRRGDFYPSPDNPTVQLTIRESGRRYRALPPDELKDKVDDILLDWEDVQAWQLDCNRLRTSLRKTFNLKPAASRPVDGLFYIGRCDCNREHRHVYACLATSDHGALQAAEVCTDPKKTGCILFPARHDKAADLLKGRGIASVVLRECLSIKPDGFHGECPVNCANCLLPASTQLETRLDTLEKTVMPDAKRGSKTKSSASAGGKARAKNYEPKFEEARRFMLTYHRKNPAVSFTQVRKKAAQHVSLSEIALKKRIKKGDFDDW
jgi:hypothetical protein